MDKSEQEGKNMSDNTPRYSIDNLIDAYHNYDAPKGIKDGILKFIANLTDKSPETIENAPKIARDPQLYTHANLGQTDPTGGVLTDVQTLPVGTTFQLTTTSSMRYGRIAFSKTGPCVELSETPFDSVNMPTGTHQIPIKPGKHPNNIYAILNVKPPQYMAPVCY